MDRISIPVGLIIGSYFALLSLFNLLISLVVVPWGDAYHYYLSYLGAVLVLQIAYFRLGNVYWDFIVYRSLSISLNVIGWLSTIFIVSLYFIQGFPGLIDFRTSNQHSFGFLWLVLNLGLLLSPFGNYKRSYAYFLLLLLGVLMTGSRLYLFVYIIFSLLVFRVNLLSIKALFIGVVSVFLSAVLAMMRENLGSGGFNQNSLLFFVMELVERNVALLNGISIANKACISDLNYISPFLLLVPRAIYSEKPLVFNVQAFMCYFDKIDVPSKSSGFFVVEHFLIYGELGGVALFVNAVLYGLIIYIGFNYCSNLTRLVLIPIIILSVFGPIDGLSSSSFQLGLLLLGVFVSYALLPKKNSGYFNPSFKRKRRAEI